jgi:enterochelin esterase-like enzyme
MIRNHNCPIALLSATATLIFVLAGCRQSATPPPAVVTATAQPSTPSTTAPTEPPAPTPTVPVCHETSGMLTREMLDSALLGFSYEVSVYTPPCYGFDPATRYPVLYLLHGQAMDDTAWPNLGVPEIADQLIVEEGAAPFLMVMPREVQDRIPVLDSAFPESFMTELIPWVQQMYWVCTTRDCRAIGGISRGGGWAMTLAFEYIEDFSSVGAHSMGSMPGNGSRMRSLVEERGVEIFPRIYMDRGETDFLAEDIDKFEAELTLYGIPHEFIISPGAHNTSYWRDHVAAYLRWYVEGWE